MGRTEQEYLDDQAECVAKIEHEWLIWPINRLSLDDAKSVEAVVREVLDPDQSLDKVTTHHGDAILFWCASPNDEQRERINSIDKVRCDAAS